MCIKPQRKNSSHKPLLQNAKMYKEKVNKVNSLPAPTCCGITKGIALNTFTTVVCVVGSFSICYSVSRHPSKSIGMLQLIPCSSSTIWRINHSGCSLSMDYVCTLITKKRICKYSYTLKKDLLTKAPRIIN